METKNIYQKLSEFQSRVGKLSKDQTNPFYKRNYTDINAVLDAIRDPLKEVGLVVTQNPTIIDNEKGLETYLVNLNDMVDGKYETIRSFTPFILAKQDMQGLGSAITYARRYALVSMLGLEQEDDDGNKSIKKEPVKIGNENKGNPFQDMKDTKNRKEAAKVWGDNEALQKDKEFLDLTKKTNIKFIMLSFKKKLEDCMVEKQLETEYTEILVNKDYRTLPVKEKEQLTEIKNKLLETFK